MSRHLYGGRRDAERLQPLPPAGLIDFYHWIPISREPAPPDVSDCRTARTGPYACVVFEPLLTKAPRPPKATPYCCYLRTVIFYHYPYIVRPPGWYRSSTGELRRGETGPFVQWDEIEHRLHWDTLINFDGQVFEIGGGRVIWRDRSWWMLRDGWANTRAARKAMGLPENAPIKPRVIQ